MPSSNRERDAAFQLVAVVRELSLARDVPTVVDIVRRAARALTGADGATFILREGPLCHYVDEDAIGPLWKGKRFPLEACISGWAMLNRESAVIPDIYSDPRIPVDAYRPTFVKSLAMVPIRRNAPIGAIGNYWASSHTATPTEVELLQALADSTSVALENVQVYAQLEQRVRDRTAELEVANKELEAFSYSVSHDLRAPIRHIDGYASLLARREFTDPQARDYLGKLQRSVHHMNELIEDMLKLSRVTAASLSRIRLDLSAIAQEIAAHTSANDPRRKVAFVIAPNLLVEGDPALLRIALANLIGNAWKFTSGTPAPEIHVGATPGKPGEFFVRDNGAGFEAANASRLFQPFQRFHSQTEFPGHGVGLATVHRIVQKHGGTIRAESAPNRGAGFYFTLGA